MYCIVACILPIIHFDRPPPTLGIMQWYSHLKVKGHPSKTAKEILLQPYHRKLASWPCFNIKSVFPSMGILIKTVIRLSYLIMGTPLLVMWHLYISATSNFSYFYLFSKQNVFLYAASAEFYFYVFAFPKNRLRQSSLTDCDSTSYNFHKGMLILINLLLIDDVHHHLVASQWKSNWPALMYSTT